jgi:hypothetical protein
MCLTIISPSSTTYAFPCICALFAALTAASPPNDKKSQGLITSALINPRCLFVLFYNNNNINNNNKIQNSNNST